jgi:thiol-disulfide isomerase/thioredoxin
VNAAFPPIPARPATWREAWPLVLVWMLVWVPVGRNWAGPLANLEFANGDVLPGNLEAGPGDVIQWRAAPFEAPLRIDPTFLKRMSFDRLPNPGEAASFRALMRNGDVVHGELERLGPGFVELRSLRHGTTRLTTDAMLQLSRLDNPALRFSGPVSLEGWTQGGGAREEQLWFGVPGGGLMTRRWGATLLRSIPMPERVAVEVKLSSSRRPEFCLALEPLRNDTLRIETWDDELVIVAEGGDFQRLATLDPAARGVHLHLFWDLQTGRMAIHEGGGALLGTRMVRPSAEFGKRPGFFLRNKGLNLELARLRVAEWNGARPELQSIEGRRIQKVDGSALSEQAVGFDAAADRLLLEGGKTLDLADLEAMVFSERSADGDSRHVVRLNYGDGTRVSGDLAGCREDAVLVRTEYAAAPVPCTFGELVSLDFSHRSGPEVTDTPDELILDGVSYRGSLAGVEGGGRILWRPIGVSDPAVLRTGTDAEVIRRKGPALTHLAGDRLFLSSGEILSCRLESIRDGEVRFASPVTETDRLPLAQVRAAEFGQPDLRLSGFGDASWQPLEPAPGAVVGTNLLEPGRIVLRGGGYAHPGVLRADEVHFALDWEGEGQGAVTVGLFAMPGPAFSVPLQVSFSRWGNRIWVAASQPGGNRMIDGDDIMIQGGKLAARIELRDEQVVVSVNGQELVDCELPSEQRSGSGLRFDFGGPWFNAETTLASVTVSGFEMRSSNGLVRSFRVDDDVKNKALTIPRRLKDHPPTDCLVASNGDVLRGSVVEVDRDGVRFDLLGELVRFPRQRVWGMVRLADPDAVPAASDAPTEGETCLFLGDGSVLRLASSGVGQAHLSGISPLLGGCKVPLASVRRLRVGKPVPLADELLHASWVARPAPEPVLPGAGGAPESAGAAGLAPDFTLGGLTGGPFSLRSARGSIVVLEFWATWCGPCRAAFGEYLEVLKTFDPAKVRFVAVNVGEPAAVINPYLKANGWDFPVALDAAETVKGLYGVEGIPHTVVIDPEGKIVWSQSGFRPGAGRDLAQVISGLLSR